MTDNLKRIRLLGSSFSLKVDEDPAYFDSLIKYIEANFSKVEAKMGYAILYGSPSFRVYF